MVTSCKLQECRLETRPHRLAALLGSLMLYHQHVSIITADIAEKGISKADIALHEKQCRFEGSGWRYDRGAI